MSYHSIHLKFPAKAPFDREDWFESFVGHFVKPLLMTDLVKQYWFTRYGDREVREIRLRLTTDDYSRLQPIIEKQINSYGFIDLKDELNETLAGSLGNERFLSPEALNSSPQGRGQLMLNLQHSIAALFVDALTGPDKDGYFRQEKSNSNQNPHGSIFESVHHLFCNTTDVTTEVEMFVTGDQQLCIFSPLYSSHVLPQLHQQRIPVNFCGRFRVRF
jgi:hypothetical protein